MIAGAEEAAANNDAAVADGEVDEAVDNEIDPDPRVGIDFRGPFR